MGKSERETVVIINLADLEDGYFSFGTSESSHFKRLCKRIGGESALIEVRYDKDRRGIVRWWQCRVPAQFLSKRTFRIGLRANRNTSKALASRKASFESKTNVRRSV